ncbi:MAG: CPBP family intramembrane metalloprotease [Bacteroidales bacterium]|nr:CPBP family intramembrane metalloprotease [Bacteroidales bacterium]
MRELLKWNNADLEMLMAVGLTTLGFIIYWFLALVEGVKKKFESKYGKEKSLIAWVLYQKQMGVLFLGIVPAIAVFIVFPEHGWKYYGVTLQNFGDSLLYLLGVAVIITPLALISARKPDTIATYPQIRAKNWTPGLLVLNTLNWSMYLLAYEFLFRGILLMLLVPVIGVWPAIIINTSLYSATHIPKGAKETISAIPFGIALCLITLDTGSIFVAFVAHVLLSQLNDYCALHFNPEMKIVRRG